MSFKHEVLHFPNENRWIARSSYGNRSLQLGYTDFLPTEFELREDFEFLDQKLDLAITVEMNKL